HCLNARIGNALALAAFDFLKFKRRAAFFSLKPVYLAAVFLPIVKDNNRFGGLRIFDEDFDFFTVLAELVRVCYATVSGQQINLPLFPIGQQHEGFFLGDLDDNPTKEPAQESGPPSEEGTVINEQAKRHGFPSYC